MIQSYNTLVNTLTQFANNHLTLQRFKCSFFEQLPNFSTADNNFPILYAIPSDVSMGENIDEFSFRIYCVDILQKDRKNEATIINETLLVLRDLNNWLRLETAHDLNILNNPRAIPVNNFLTEFTTGWYMDIVIEATPETSDCAIPFSDNFIFSGVTVDCTQVTPYLTCDTLEDCASFIALEDRVTNLETIVYRTNELLSGGATFLSGLTYDVTPLEYVINGQFYTTAAATQVTANSGDTNFDRIDLIIVDVNGTVSILEGTPSANPVQPDVDETTQVVVAILTVPAGATAIPIQETLVYNEDVGVPTEWNGSVTDATIDLAYSGITYSGTKSLRFNLTPNTAYAQFNSTTNFDTSVQNTIQFWIYNTVAWTSAQRLSLRLRNAANATVGTVVQLYNARYGFSATASSVGVWQLVSIPIADFNLSSPIIGRIDFQSWVSSGVGLSCIIDVVKFVEGASNASQTNKWWFVRGNTATTIIPTTTNSTLRLAGGSNINTYASGTNFINFDLNTTLTGLTSVSATTFYGDGSNLTGINIPVGYWTAGTGTNSIISVNGSHVNNGGYSTIVNGSNNTISNGYNNSILGGKFNIVTAGYENTIIGGTSNTIPSGYENVIAGGNNNTASSYNSFIGGGYFNNATGNSSAILGGSLNNSTGPTSAIVGGGSNTASQTNSTVVGGAFNTSSGAGGFIGGGYGNTASASNSAILGGQANQAIYARSAVIGGGGNISNGYNAFIGGGYGNGANFQNTAVIGGAYNTASGFESAVIGGQSNTSSSTNAFIGGGSSNTASAGNSSVVGGISNSVTSTYSAIIGGEGNIASTNNSSFIGGGKNNRATGLRSFIGGGQANSATTTYSAVIGGYDNTASGSMSFVGGGKQSIASGNYGSGVFASYISTASGDYGCVVIGGANNLASVIGSSVIGGNSNSATGDHSFVGGGVGNSATTSYSSVIAGRFNKVSGQHSVIIGGQNITGSTNDTVYVPYLNIGSLSATTTATTYENLVINTNGDVMTNNQFYIGVNFTVTGVTWDYVALNTFSIYSIDNPSAIGYSLLHNGTAYTLTNIINLYDDLQITGVTATGVLKLNATL